MHTSEEVVYIGVIPLMELQQMQKQLAILTLISHLPQGITPPTFIHLFYICKKKSSLGFPEVSIH